MRNFIYPIILLFTISIFAVQSSYADCQLDGMIPLEGNIISCPQPLQTTPLDTFSMPATTIENDEVTIPNPGGIDILAGFAIDTDEGDDTVIVNGRIRSASGVGLETRQDSDTIIINDGADIMNTGAVPANSAVQSGADPDFVTVNGGSIVSTSGDGMRTGSGGDMVTVNGGEFTGAPGRFSIDTRSDPDFVTINGGIFNSPIGTLTGGDTVIVNGGTFNNNVGIDTQNQADTIHITTDVDMGLINCGPQDDTLILSMDVPEGEVANLTAEFIDDGPVGSMVINGINYSWTGCENRVPNFNGVVTTLTLTPEFDTSEITQGHAFTATVLTDGQPTAGVAVTLRIISGPNAGLEQTFNTFDTGSVLFVYTSEELGTDVAVATIEVPGLGTLQSNPAVNVWILPPRNVPTLGEWGLISMAAILGIIGFMVIRKRQVA